MGLLSWEAVHCPSQAHHLVQSSVAVELYA